MALLEITKMSSKGQIVIPQEMRKGFHEGEKFVVMKAGKQLILKSVEDFDENIEEDLEFARRTEEAWKSYERGEFKSLPMDEFLKELKRG
jgi:AbrB family looped-hinge helix DNA binding protein